MLFHGTYLYMLRGRYSAKYAVHEDPGSVWSVIEFFDFGAIATDLVVAGPAEVFKGKAYVPLKNSQSGVLDRFMELDTVSTTTVEVQDLAISGTPTTGTWTATFDGKTSATIAIDATAAIVQTTLRAIPGLQKVIVTRSGSTPNFTYTVTMTAAPGALATTSPPQLTAADTFDVGGVTPSTTTAGTSDQWDRGPEAKEAGSFTLWQHPISGPVLVKAKDNTVALVSSDPMVAGNWGTDFEVGDTGQDITALASYGRDLVAGKADGLLYTFDTQANAIPVPDVGGQADSEAWIGMKTVFGHLLAPLDTAFWRWRPGAARLVGPEQEGYLDGSRTEGWGKVMDVCKYGVQTFYTVADNFNGKGAVCSLLPGEARGPLTPHMHHLLTTPVETCAVLELAGRPTSPVAANTVVDDAAVGTIAWQNPSNASGSEDAYATAAVGTSHYLKATLAADTRVPTDATVTGVEVLIERSAINDFPYTFPFDFGLNVTDNIVRLVRGGTVVGDDKASGDQWPGMDVVRSYGGSTDLWGTTLTPAQVNASDFGVVLSATVTVAQARVDQIRITVHYTTSGASDPAHFLAVIVIDAARTRATPHIYKLPRAGLSVANDPNISRAIDHAEFRTSRYANPGREVQKTWRAVEFDVELSPQTNTPGFQMFASIEDGADFQLQTDAEASSPAGATFLTSGFKRVFFPLTSAVGRWMQLVPRVPTISGQEVGVAVTLRDIVVRGSFRVESTDGMVAVVRLQEGHTYPDAGHERRTSKQQRLDLEALADPESAPVAYRSPDSRSGHCEVTGVSMREVRFKGKEASEWVSVVRFRKAPYG